MAREMTIITPSIVETELTGFIGAAEKQSGPTHWRVEFWRTNGNVRLIRNGKPVSWDKAGQNGHKLAHAYAAFLKSLKALQP